jgi:membrane protein
LRANQTGAFTAFVSSRNQQRVLSVVRYLQVQYRESCALKSLASLARLSPFHFLRIFREVTGQSPAQYVLNIRLRAAADVLLNTRAPITEIALRSGFNDIPHFNASFRSVFGRSPMQWRVGWRRRLTRTKSAAQKRRADPSSLIMANCLVGKGLPGKMFVVARDTVAAWIKHNASSLGAALSFYTLFSIAPILVIAMSVAGYVFGENVAEKRVLDEMRGLLGDAGAKAVQSLLASAHQSGLKGVAAVIGVVTLLVGATSVFGELQNTLDYIWKSPEKHPVAWWRIVRSRVLSVGLILGVGFLLLVSLVISAALAAFGAWFGSYLAQWSVILPAIDLILSLALTTVLFAMIFKYVPREKLAWGDVWIGGMVTACLFTVGKLLIGLYLGRSSLSSAYGAAGSIMVLLLWIYYSAQIFLLGAEFTRVFTYALGSRRRAAK